MKNILTVKRYIRFTLLLFTILVLPFVFSLTVPSPLILQGNVRTIGPFTKGQDARCSFRLVNFRPYPIQISIPRQQGCDCLTVLPQNMVLKPFSSQIIAVTAITDVLGESTKGVPLQIQDGFHHSESWLFANITVVKDSNISKD